MFFKKRPHIFEQISKSPSVDFGLKLLEIGYGSQNKMYSGKYAVVIFSIIFEMINFFNEAQSDCKNARIFELQLENFLEQISIQVLNTDVESLVRKKSSQNEILNKACFVNFLYQSQEALKLIKNKPLKTEITKIFQNIFSEYDVPYYIEESDSDSDGESPRNKYLAECGKTFKILGNQIILEKFNFIRDEIYYKVFTLEEFCKFLKVNHYGIKRFSNSREQVEEQIKIEKFVETFKDEKEFLRSNTCLAFCKENENEIYTVVNGAKAIVYKNASGDLMLKKVQSILKLDQAFAAIYEKCYKFIETIHERSWCYCDLKCKNIFVMLSSRDPPKTIKPKDIIIGDYGSLYIPSDFDNPVNRCIYTFVTPSSNDFIDFWIKGGLGYKYSVSKEIRTLFKSNPTVKNIFSKANLRKVYETWMKVYKDSEDSVSKHIFFARANDWFHFGIAMIELITYIKKKDLYDKIMKIFNIFCREPIMDDKQLEKQKKY